ncbi:uncharacterized protein [Coffea arabica]|uniref:DDE Tnp4 domain-containing protein n=1 Tax=Coffea arabica TaxID=13443 RepID=A0ABM4V965_COFAR
MHIQGGYLDDERDDIDLDNILMAVVLLGFIFFDPFINLVPRRRRVRDSSLSGRDYVLELINGHRDRIIENMRMDVPLFLHLCDLLVERDYWHAYPSQRVGVHESVVLTLMCLSHDERLRNFDDTYPRIMHNGQFWPWFKDCVGALEGTHVSAWCTTEIRERYINRHGGLSQNMLATCNYDMRFVYARVGWEGSAHDGRILQNTLLDPNSGFSMPQLGKYYAVDAAYTNMSEFMAPFRGTRGTQYERAAKDCVGALEGTHVSAWCTTEIRERYINRHGGLSQNMLATCNYDMRFVYARVGWEGSAHDGRILQNTLLDPNSGFSMPQLGKYYAVDAAYTNMSEFMAPFRGTRGTQYERAAKVLFNRRHASFRNIIERTFGVLKRHFPTLRGPIQNYLIAIQNNIVLACCTLHNFIRDHSPNDLYFNEEATFGDFADAQVAGNQVQGVQPIDMS